LDLGANITIQELQRLQECKVGFINYRCFKVGMTSRLDKCICILFVKVQEPSKYHVALSIDWMLLHYHVMIYTTFLRIWYMLLDVVDAVQMAMQSRPSRFAGGLGLPRSTFVFNGRLCNPQTNSFTFHLHTHLIAPSLPSAPSPTPT
jgi:hypothetical protein